MTVEDITARMNREMDFALVVATSAADRIVRILRTADSNASAKRQIAEEMDLSDIQVEAVMNMQVRDFGKEAEGDRKANPR